MRDLLTHLGFGERKPSERIEKAQSPREQFRRLFPLYRQQGFVLNWNPSIKTFFIWKEDSRFFPTADGCVDIFVHFKNRDEAFDVENIAANVALVERKISAHIRSENKL